MSFVITLFGCGNQEEVDQNTQVETPTDEKNESDGVFTKEDQNIAEKKAKEFIVLLTEFHGRTVKTSEDYKVIQEEMTKKAETQGLLHEEAHFVQPNDIVQDDEGLLMLSSEKFTLSKAVVEKHYEYLDAHELIIPLTYNSANSVNHNYTFKFVKTLDDEIKISKALLVIGIDLEKDDEDAYYDEYERKELQEEMKNDLKIQ